MFTLSRSERLVIAGFAALALAFFWFEDSVFAWLATQHPLVGILAYMVVNPAYALFLWFAFRLSKWEGVFAGVFVLAAFDLAFFSKVGFVSVVAEGVIPGQALVTRVVLPTVLLLVAAFVSRNERGLFSELIGI